MVEGGRAHWRRDLDALAFEPDGHRSVCVVHRLAFRSLLRLTPTPADFAVHEGAFRTAAQGKIVRRRIKSGVSFHLTSRDLSRALAVAK
jgi:hypothetical protein